MCGKDQDWHILHVATEDTQVWAIIDNLQGQ
jgi:hypothetical protein